MNRRVIAAAIAVLTLGVGQVSSRALRVALDSKVTESDFIGVVRILEIRPLEEPTDRDAGRPYQQLARAEILQSMKGPLAGTIVELEFDNGLVCPNATYSTETDYLVFWRAIGTDRYATYNFYHGKFLLDDGRVVGWEGEWEHPPTLEAVASEIQRLSD